MKRKFEWKSPAEANTAATNKRLAKKRFLWIIETLCNAFSFKVIEKIELCNPLIRQAPFINSKFKSDIV
jgi:hypothetical protein